MQKLLVQTKHLVQSDLIHRLLKSMVWYIHQELSLLTQLPHFEERVYARILPLPQAVASCSEMGFRGNRDLICMQGPFPSRNEIWRCSGNTAAVTC